MMLAQHSKGFTLRCFALLAAFSLSGGALAVNPNELEVAPQANAQDPDPLNAPGSTIWALNFKFKSPRLIKVNVPGRGQKVCWYLWYQVTNPTSEPHTFIPDFELITQDLQTVHHDQVLPEVQEAIRQIEDPTNYYKIKNSVTIAATPIPPKQPNADPRPVTGVAIWDDVNPEANHYSIFVAGLSNGWAVTGPKQQGGPPLLRRKTPAIKFPPAGGRCM